MTTGQLVVDQRNSSPSFTANLSSGRTYRWNVRACNASGCSDFTSSLYFTTPSAPPPPTASTPSVPGDPEPGTTYSPGPSLSSTSVSLDWDSVSGADEYDLGIRDVSSGQLVTDTRTSSSRYSASLQAGRTYRWNVRACNEAGCSDFTAPLYFTTPGGGSSSGPPSTPGSTSPGSGSSPGPTLSSRVTLNWSSSSGATEYDLGVRDLTTNDLVVDRRVSGTSYSVSLVPGRRYRWNVAACNSSGCSSFTSPLYFSAQ